MSNKVAVVTGASQGIGFSTAVRLARAFGSIVLVARNRAKLENTAAAVRGAVRNPSSLTWTCPTARRRKS